MASSGSLYEIETIGRFSSGECLIMSQKRWKEDQDDLRLKAQERRRAFRFQPDFEFGGPEHREVLNLPIEGALEPSEIIAAFRHLAKTAHPDAGGSDEHYRRIAEASQALLEQFV